MAAISGKNGSVMIGTHEVAEIKSWSLDIGGEELDITDFSSAGYKEFIRGLTEWSGSFEGNLDMTDTNGQYALDAKILDGSSVTLKLYTNGTNYYTGTAFITGESPSVAVDGLAEVSFNFRGTEDIDYT